MTDDTTQQDKPVCPPEGWTRADLKSPKAIAIYDSDPGRYRILRNGTIYDTVAGRIVTVDRDLNPHALTSTTARDIAKRRQERAAIAAAQGILDSVNEHGVPAKGSIAAWRYIVKHQADIALDAKGRTSTDASYFVGRAAGMLRDGSDRQADNTSQSVDENMGKLGALADRLLQAIDAEQRRRASGDACDNLTLSKACDDVIDVDSTGSDGQDDTT